MSQPSFYSGLSLVRSELNDGGLSLAATGSRPTILIVGPASEGPTNFPQLVVEDGDVKRLYGQDTEMQKKVAEIIAQAGTEAYYIYVMRIGGIAPKIELESSAGGTITLTPLHYSDREASARLKVLLTSHTVNGVDEQRVIVYDIEEEGYVWDSHSILQIAEKPFLVEQTGDFADSSGNPLVHGIGSDGVFHPGEILPLLDVDESGYEPSSSITSDYAIADFAKHYIWSDTQSTDTFIATIKRQGNDGQTIPLVQKYVFMDRALESLTFKEFDYILPCGGYHLDSPNIADSVSGGLIVHHELQGAQPVHSSVDFSSLPIGTGPSKPSADLSIDSNNVLGWLWQTEFEGEKYYYMSSKKGWDLFDAMTQTFTVEVPDQVVSFSVTHASGTTTFDLTLGPEWKDGGATSIATTADPVSVLDANAPTYVANAISIEIGELGATLGDVINYVENLLEARVRTATGITTGTISVSHAANSAHLLEAITGSAQLGQTTLNGSASESIDIEFDRTLDPYEVHIVAGAGDSLVESTTSDGQVLTITFDAATNLSGLNTLFGTPTITGDTGAFTLSNAVSTGTPASADSSLAVAKIDGVLQGAFPVEAELDYTNNYLDHEELTGEEIPTEVTALFEAGLPGEFRECSFAHLMGSWCHKSSSTWKTIMTCMTFEGPATPNAAVTIGKIPTYTSIAGKLAIDTASEGGKGILGYKFSAGAPAYRAQVLGSIASSSDGYAYGGLILTKGDNLPSGIEPYGIDDSDEATDVKGFGVDIGKYIVPTAMWVTHSNAFDQYYGDLTGVVTGMIGITPIGNEPIGPVNGSVSGVRATFASTIQARSIGKLAQAGYTTVVYNPVRGVYLNNMRTLAHRYSDYRKVSTIRAVNRVVQGVRNLAQDYIGLAYNSANVASLRTAINGYLRSEQTAGIHNGAVAQIAFSREDRMLGNITIRLTMVPPYAIESINIITSLIADESNLQ